MSIQKIIQESIAGNPLEMKEALAEELRNRVAESIAAKMEEVELDESVSFKKTDSGDHHIHFNGNPVGKITKTSSMGSSGYSVRIGGNTSKHEVSDESSLKAAKDSAKWHLTSSESPVKMKEEVEQIDEISKSTLGSYATKALNRGDIANRMSKSDDDAMGKIANKRLSGVKKAVDKLADKTGKKALATSIKKDVDKTKAAGDAYTRKTGVDDQGKSYYRAASNIGKMREEVELDESEGRQIVDKLKSTGNHEEAGKMAFKHGLGRNYGPHFGMRSNKYSAETAYHKGYDKAELANRKNT